MTLRLLTFISLRHKDAWFRRARASSKELSLQTTPLILLVLCVLSYGLLVSTLGFYWDDWPLLWVWRSQGTSGVVAYEALGRPLNNWLCAATLALIGEKPLAWHLLALAGRWLSAVAFWWWLRGLWPRKTWEIASAACLFAVYPGFTQQPIALSYAIEFVSLVCFGFSLGAMVWAQRKPALFWPLTVSAVLASALSLMTAENYYGLDLMRPAILWLVIGETVPERYQRARNAVKYWVPYLSVWSLLLAWRLFFVSRDTGYKDPSAYLQQILRNPFSELLTRTWRAVQDVIETGLMAWVQAFRPEAFDLSSRAVWMGLLLAILSWIVVVSYLSRLRAESNAPPTPGNEAGWPRSAMALSLIALVAGGLPVWFANRQVTLDNLNNRYALAEMFGACILVVALVQMIARTRRQQIVTVGVVIGLAVGLQFRNANGYRRDWASQKALFSQLAWRAPGLKRGTAVLLDDRRVSIPGHFEALANDYSLSPPLNILYSGNLETAPADYWLFNLSQQLGSIVPGIERDIPLKRRLRTIEFSGSTSNSLAIWFSPPSCLRVLDPVRDELPQLTALARASQRISNPSLIEDDKTAAGRLASIFGSDPADSWCYYFEKADLARQNGEWETVARLGDEARQKRLSPADATEWLPFIESYLETGRYEDSREITGKVLGARPRGDISSTTAGNLSAGPTIEPALAHMWKRIEGTPKSDAARAAFIAEMKARVAKPAP